MTRTRELKNSRTQALKKVGCEIAARSLGLLWISRVHEFSSSRVRAIPGSDNGVLPTRSLAKACCEMSRRDGAIVAWHEVPGTASPQKSRPVGYGVIRAGVRTDSMIGVTKFRILRNTAPISTRNTSGISYARSYRTLRDGSFEGR